MIAQERPLFGFIRPAPPGPRKRAETRCRVLEVMAASVESDIPLSPVIAAAAEESRGSARRAMDELCALLDSGLRLGTAMESCELLAFPEHTVAAVQAAEGTPRLAGVLAAAAADDVAVENRRAAVWAAVFYPLLVVAMVGGFAGGVLGITHEKFLDVMASMEVSEPPVFALAATAGDVAGWIALGAAEFLAAAWLVRRFPRLAMGLHDLFRPMAQALPLVRGASRLGGAARLLRAMEPGVRARLPLHDVLARAAVAAGCEAVTVSALDAAARAQRGAPIDDVAAALLLPAAVRPRLAMAAARAPDEFADAIRSLAGDCTTRYRDALDARMRWLQIVATLFVGALVFTQFLGVFAFLEATRRQAMPW